MFWSRRRAAREFQQLVDTLRMQITPLSHDVTRISNEATMLLGDIRRQVEKVDDGVTAVRDMAVRVQSFEEEIEERVGEPLRDFAVLLNALARGMEAFFRVLLR